jgi:hypothetical protein
MPNGVVRLLISNALYKIGDRIKPEHKKATTLYSYLDQQQHFLTEFGLTRAS